MRGWLSLVGIVLVLAVVGLLFKKQMTTTMRGAPPALVAPGAAQSSPQDSRRPPQGSPAQIEQQYRQALQQAIQQPRPMPDDAK